jgi:hypothetical protein
LVESVTRDLRGCAYLRGGIEKIELYAETEMAAFPADDVVLVAGGNQKSMKIALRDRTRVDGLAPEGDVLNECRLPGGIERANRNVEMVFAGELPVHFSAEGGVSVKVQVLH